MSRSYDVQAAVGGPSSFQLESFGWMGAHHLPKIPAHTAIDHSVIWEPSFSVDEVSTAALDFQIIDRLNNGAVVATGTFPAGALAASAANCNLLDAMTNPVTSLTLTAPMQLVAVPVNMVPTDGQGFQAEGRATYL
jgi:hypothetical protein